MRCLAGVVAVVAWSMLDPLAYAQTADDFEQFKQQQTQDLQQFKDEEAAKFEAFVKADQEAFEQFKDEVEKLWKEFAGSTTKDWVEYGRDLDTRSRVDFESGTAVIEVLVSVNPGDGAAKLREAVADLVVSQGSSSDYSVSLPDGTVDAPRKLGDEPVLAGQVTTPDGEPVTAENAEDFAQKTLAAGEVKTERIRGGDGKEWIKHTASFPLVPDHLRRRAERYVPLVKRQARRFDLDAPLVFAVIHTESHFNPKARSGAPAYGLMQLVPTSGGRAAYEYVYKQDKVLPPSYFYEPDQNIELGCGYLKFLRQSVYGGVRDDSKALYCIVSAYNTGPANVSRAVTGERKVRAAIPVIDAMGAADLQARLLASLPYEETRAYLKKVTERMTLYEEWR